MSTVVVADAELKSRRRVEQVLSHEAVTVESVASADALRAKLQTSQPAVVIVDVALPDGDPTTLIDQMRATGTQVLVMAPPAAAAAASDVVERATEYIAKPIDADELRLRVRRVLRQVAPGAVVRADLHNPQSGRIDAKRVAEALGVKLTQLPQALNVGYKALHKTPDAPALQGRLQPIKDAIVLVSRFVRTQDVRVWLNSPHPDLRRRKPLDVILSGRASAVVTMLENALAGIPS